jgi:saccharopine dehydrogenase-like NADP-dependent oxidoreductase
LVRRFEDKLSMVVEVRGFSAGLQRQTGIGVLCAMALDLLQTSEWPEGMRITRQEIGLNDDLLEELMEKFGLTANTRLQQLSVA